MDAFSGNSFEIRLRNAQGIPILQLGGNLTRNALTAIASTLDRLANAGHYHIVINLEAAQTSNWAFLSSLTDAFGKIAAHHGSVDLVAAPTMPDLDITGKLVRLCKSEAQAVSLIKRLPRGLAKVTATNARLLEKK